MRNNKKMAENVNLSNVANQRLYNQHIAVSRFKTAIEMVAWHGAVQAQEYAQTKWSLGLRLPHLTDNDIEKDFSEGRIIRTHILRPTWHFVTAQDIRWLLKLSAPRVHAMNAYMYRKLELDAAVFKRCNDILSKTLQGHRQLTRSALNQEFKKNKIIAKGHRLSYIMMQAELEGIICSGARNGKQFTYALLEERIPITYDEKSKEEALAELTSRYFRSKGPATIKDFSNWSGLTISACKKGMAMVRESFIKEEINETNFFFSPDSPSRQLQFQKLYLLPGYDELFSGYKESRNVFMEYSNSLNPKPVFRFDNAILYDGQIIGTWKRTIQRKTIDIEYDFFEPPDSNQWNAFSQAVQDFQIFTGLVIRFFKYSGHINK
jgi:hypothetical protein